MGMSFKYNDINGAVIGSAMKVPRSLETVSQKLFTKGA